MLQLTQPNPFKTPEEKEEKDFQFWKDNIRFVYSHYNKRNARVNSVSKKRTKDQPDDESPIAEIERMISYYLGRQDNNDYYYTTQDEDNQPLNTIWIGGQKIVGLVDFMLGKFIDLIQNIEPAVKTISKAAYNRKTELLEKAMIKLQAPNLFEDMRSYGLEYEPIQGKEFESTDDLKRYMAGDYREPYEELGYKITQDIMLRNHSTEQFKQAALYLLLGGYIGIENEVLNGKVYFNTILPQNLIIDRFIDNDQHRKDRFAGVVTWYTPTDILDRWSDKLSESEKQELMEMTTTNMDSTLGLQNSPTATSWITTNEGLPLIGAVRAYWIGPKELRYEKNVDRYGNTHYGKMQKGNKKTSKFVTKTVYTGTLIGNKYLVDYGEATNIVRSTDNPGDPLLPIHVFMPNMVKGENVSIVRRLHKHQDRIDYLANEQTKRINAAIGKVYLINKHKLGSHTPQEVLNDFKRMGFHITDGNADGEEQTAEKFDKTVEVVDMTIDPNVMLLAELMRDQERLMGEIVNLPPIALGQQTGYVGGKVQAGTIAQSSQGTAYIYQGFIQFVEKQLNHALNQAKVALMSESNAEIPLIGDKGIAYLKLTKEFTFEELGLYFHIKDYIDEESRNRLISYAQAMAQNGLIDPIDMLNIEECTTYSQLRSELKYSMTKKAEDAQKQQAMVMMMQQAQSAQMNQTQSSMEQMRQEGSNYRTEVKASADVIKSANPEQPQ